jgi:radical SAM protein with 4Fe4S-binding SPASM domain
MTNKLRHSPDGFRRLMRRARVASEISRGLENDRQFALDLPAEVGIKLNNGCNLRCSHCFEWNENGYHQSFDTAGKRAELSLDDLQTILDFTRSSNASLYLWGGEPLMHSKFAELTSLLANEQRWTTICTNGVLIEKRIEDLIRLSPDIALLVSLEGLEQANDHVRGKGTFNKVLSGIDLALAMRRSGSYRGAVSLSLTLNDHAVDTLTDFVEFFDRRGVDSIYLVFPWYVPPDVATEMDRFVHRALLDQLPMLGAGSWHSFTFHLSPEKIPVLHKQRNEIMNRSWNTHVRFHPQLTVDEVDAFVMGSSKPAEGKVACHAIRRRMDVLPNGDVVSCKFYPETRMGNLSTTSPLEIWKGEKYSHFRNCLADGLSPVCSKCTLLYTTG